MAKFKNFNELFTSSVEEGVGDNVINIQISKLVAFKNHPFKLYEGDRLEDMVESVKENGVLNPLIVRENKNKYEILSGHNRANAAKIAGLTEVPCVIKKNLSDEDAYTYVVETNLIQRSFNDLLPSEKGKVLKEKYDNIKNQGRRNDIIRELKKLNGEEFEEEKPDSRSSVGLQYGLSSSTVARLIKITELIPEMLQMVDEEKLGIIPGVELSHISKEGQKIVYEVLTENNLSLSAPNAKKIREIKKITKDSVLEIFVTPKKEAYQKVKLSGNIYNKYFKDKKPKEVEKIIEKALKEYFDK